MPKQDDIFTRKINFLEKAEKELGRELSKAERSLLRSVIDSLGELYNLRGVENVSNSQMANAISTAFARWSREKYAEIITRIANDQIKVGLYNSEYFAEVILDKARVDRIQSSVLRKSLLTFGIDYEGSTARIVPGGFLDLARSVSTDSIRADIVREVSESFASNEGFAQTSARLRQMIRRAKDGKGKLERYYKQNVYDAYAKKDRIESDQFAQELELTAFMYMGTEIDATRDFCEKRIGKVFLRSEARKWRDIEFAGKTDPYNPIRDLGGYNCRHYAQFISNRRAMRLRKDLEQDQNGKLRVKR